MIYQDISLASLPSLPFSDRHLLPRKSGVYFALSLTEDVLYVGQTTNLYLRWKVHHRLERLEAMQCQHIAWYSCPRDRLEEIEWEMIQRYDPPINMEKRAPYKPHVAAAFPTTPPPQPPYHLPKSRPRTTDPVVEALYHLAWQPAPTYTVLLYSVREDLEELLRNIAHQNRILVHEITIHADHVHMALSIPPTIAPADAVKLFKGISARQLRLMFPDLRKRTRADRLWAPSYYYGTAGHVSAETIRQYIESQEKHYGE
jgi:putative transposase